MLSLESPSMQIKLYKEIMKHGYSVRKVEEMVNILKNGEDIQTATKTLRGQTSLPEEYLALRNRIADKLSAKVQMSCSAKGKGKITIPFASDEELERIIMLLDKV